MATDRKRFIVLTEFGELLDLCMWLQDVEGHDVVMCVLERSERGVGEGLVPKTDEWWRYVGRGYTWVVDGCEHGDLQDWLRSEGEAVFGGSKLGDRMENERQMNQEWFAECGFDQPESRNFTSIAEAMDFVSENSDRRWILKQNGSAPKAISHMGKFDGSEDMMFHLRQLERSWNVAKYGPVDFDLMEVVTGVEVSATAFWNGHDWMRGRDGRCAGFWCFEEKKEADQGMGQTTGETGTTFFGASHEHPLFKSILRPEVEEFLAESGFRGCFDINCIVTDDGRIVALEPTMRPGIPTTSYVMMEGVLSGTGELIDAVARGEDAVLTVQKGCGMVMVVQCPPYPIEAHTESLVDESVTSVGQRLWMLDGRGGLAGPLMDESQRRHLHLSNFQLAEDEGTGETYYRAVTKSGYMLTATGIGWDIEATRSDLIAYIRGNIYLPSMKFRLDIGKRAEDFVIDRGIQ